MARFTYILGLDKYRQYEHDVPNSGIEIKALSLTGHMTMYIAGPNVVPAAASVGPEAQVQVMGSASDLQTSIVVADSSYKLVFKTQNGEGFAYLGGEQ